MCCSMIQCSCYICGQRWPCPCDMIQCSCYICGQRWHVHVAWYSVYVTSVDRGGMSTWHGTVFMLHLWTEVACPRGMIQCSCYICGQRWPATAAVGSSRPACLGRRTTLSRSTPSTTPWGPVTSRSPASPARASGASQYNRLILPFPPPPPPPPPVISDILSSVSDTHSGTLMQLLYT